MKKTLSITFVLLLIAACAVPGIAYLAGYEAQNLENRPLAREARLVARGSLNLSYPADFDAWWQDHFGLREEAVTAFHALTMAVFRDTLNQKVVVGRGNYLFYSETMDNYLGLSRMSEEDIQKAAVSLRLQRDYCAAHNMAFVFMAAPNKNTVYPEYMPGRFAPTGEASNRARLYEALAGMGVATVDLAAELRAHKTEGDLYFEQDTHWNRRGALVGYHALMRAVASGFAYATYDLAAGEARHDHRGDLHNFVLPAAEGKLLSIHYDIAPSYEVDAGANAMRDANFGTTSGANGFRLLFFRDSFGELLIPLISGNAGRVMYAQEFPYNYVFAGEAFDAVAIELVERNIPNLARHAPLMPAVETELPEDAAEVPVALLSREKSGYAQLYGAYDGAYRGTVYLEVSFEDGVRRVFEAFPVLDAQAAPAASSMASPQGFVLTLPMECGAWAGARVFAAPAPRGQPLA